MVWQKSKYGNTKAEYNGKKYHSRFEADVAAELEIMKRAGELKEIKSQHKFRLNVAGTHITTYIVDFKVITADDTVQYIEAKGFMTELARVKMKLLEALLPDIEPGAQFHIWWYSGKRERKC